MLSKNQKTGIIIGVFILCLLAVFLVYKPQIIVNNKFAEKINNKPIVPNEQETKVILSQPTAEAENEYQGLIDKYAINTQILNIGKDCKMDPLIIKFKGNSILVIANNDSKEHVISFENQNFFGVSAGDKREINIKETFGLAEGVWLYRCGDLSTEQNVGAMYITQ